MAVSEIVIHSAHGELGDELLRIEAPDAGLYFGSAVDISGSTLIVGTGIRWAGQAPESAESVYVCEIAIQGIKE